MPGSVYITRSPIRTKRDVFWANVIQSVQTLLMALVAGMFVFLVPFSNGCSLFLVVPVGSIIIGTPLYWELDGIWRKHWYIVSNTDQTVEELLATLPNK